MKFNEFVNTRDVILEGNDKVKLHLSHLEDLAIEHGKEGFHDFEDHVKGLLNFVCGLSSNARLGVKIDGSPAIFFGEDPRPTFKGQFFVATKAAFSIGVPKICHTNEEIDQFYADSTVAGILKRCLAILSNCNDRSGFIYQGDLLFSSLAEKKITEVNGVTYLTFRPNTITYAIPVDTKSPLFNIVNMAEVGIILHDRFSAIPVNNGQAITTKLADRNFTDIKNLGRSNNVYIDDSSHESVNLQISTESRQRISNLIYSCKNYIHEISNEFDREWKNSQLLNLLKMYINAQVRGDGGIFRSALKKETFDDDKFKREFKRWINQRFTEESIKKVSDKGKISTLARRDALFEWIDQNLHNFNCLLHATYCMLLIKNELLKLLEGIEDKIGKVFYQQPDGSLQAGKGEGYVLFVGNNQVKLVDRMDFTSKHFAKRNENI